MGSLSTAVTSPTPGSCGASSLAAVGLAQGLPRGGPNLYQPDEAAAPDPSRRVYRQTLLPEMPDLAPTILRQRLVIEGTCRTTISDAQIRGYLARLSDVCDMRLLIEPVTHRSDQFGWAGWVHWETSGAHFYAWEQPLLFFSVDIYTCKAFDAARAIDFTRQYFDAPVIAAKEF